MITERVRLPQVTSIALPESLASCTRRLMGALSGDTTDITRDALTRLPKPILTILIKLYPSSFYILNLLADFFDGTLGFDNKLGNLKHLTLRAYCIYLAVHFLYEKIKLFADRFIKRK